MENHLELVTQQVSCKRAAHHLMKGACSHRRHVAEMVESSQAEQRRLEEVRFVRKRMCYQGELRGHM
jgi:hypothetical protein